MSTEDDDYGKNDDLGSYNTVDNDPYDSDEDDNDDSWGNDGDTWDS